MQGSYPVEGQELCRPASWYHVQSARIFEDLSSSCLNKHCRVLWISSGSDQGLYGSPLVLVCDVLWRSLILLQQTCSLLMAKD